MRLLLTGILLGFPLLEAVVLLRLSDTLGWWVLGWVVLAACAGMALIKEARFALVGLTSWRRSVVRDRLQDNPNARPKTITPAVLKVSNTAV